MDERWYTGETCAPALFGHIPGVTSPDMPRVIPVPPRVGAFRYNGVTFSRKQLPLRPATASTVHVAQGATVTAHVMTPAPNPPGHARGLTFVGLSRSRSLAQLHLTAPLLPGHFTRFRKEYGFIRAELARLKTLAQHTRAALTDGESSGTASDTDLAAASAEEGHVDEAHIGGASDRALTALAFRAAVRTCPAALVKTQQLPVSAVRGAMREWLIKQRRHDLAARLDGKSGKSSVKDRLKRARARGHT